MEYCCDETSVTPVAQLCRVEDETAYLCGHELSPVMESCGITDVCGCVATASIIGCAASSVVEDTAGGDTHEQLADGSYCRGETSRCRSAEPSSKGSACSRCANTGLRGVAYDVVDAASCYEMSDGDRAGDAQPNVTISYTGEETVARRFSGGEPQVSI